MNITEINDNTNYMNDNDNDDDDNNFMTIEISPWYLLILTIPCGISIISCILLSIYGFIKVFINKM